MRVQEEAAQSDLESERSLLEEASHSMQQQQEKTREVAATRHTQLARARERLA
eukprot:COSAG05_NODE_22067_length_267_cov_0.720238_1_plen_52_part_10